MSASNKKKLRKENDAAELTAKQQKQQAEAKKLKTISVTFVVLMLVVALTAASILVVRAVNNTGIIDRNTIAAVTGKYELNSVQMNYYFNDYVRGLYQQWQNSYGSSISLYTMMMGLDLNKPLDKQVYDVKTGDTWADYLLEEALKKAKSDYALYDKAIAEGFKLSEDEEAMLDYNMEMLDYYAMYAGYSNTDKYLRSLYGYGSNVESYKEYNKIVSIASSYYNKHKDELSYKDADIRKYEKDIYDNYTSFTYASYYVSSTDYIKGGTTNELGATVYSEAEKAAAIKAAEEIAKKLAENKNIVDLDKAIAALDINKDKKDAATTKSESVLYTSIPTAIQKWLADEKRVENEISMIPNEITSTDEDGKETKTIGGYYVVVFQGSNKNLRLLANVRHMLILFKGGTTGADGNKVYSDTEKAAAKADAEKLLKIWKDGKATEDTFIAMVKEYSQDGSAASGGLFEDIHAGSDYVESFLNWSIDDARKKGDTDLVESPYGYHVMYYVGDSDMTYRDYLISEDMRAEDQEKWYNEICDAAKITAKNTNRLNLDLIIANAFR